MDNQQPTSGSPIYQGSQETSSAKWLWLLIVIIIVGALAFAYIRGIGPLAKLRFGSKDALQSPTPSSFVFSSPSPEASAAASLDKKAPAIRVLNGSGTAGVASSVKDFIESKGYKVTAIGNAASYDFDQTVLRFKSTFKKYQEVLLKDLSGKYSVTVSSDNLEASDSADVEVIVGKK